MVTKKLFLVILLALAITAGVFAADCSITGIWGFDLNGAAATVEYKADGTLSQDMFGLKIQGTYKLQGNKLTTLVNGTSTVFTVTSCTPTQVTVKRDRDGMTVVYRKK
jgi:hypothetical protein